MVPWHSAVLAVHDHDGLCFSLLPLLQEHDQDTPWTKEMANANQIHRVRHGRAERITFHLLVLHEVR